MAPKSLRVSEAVHEEIERRKFADETFDQTLRRELDMLPAPDEFNKMTAHAPGDGDLELATVVDGLTDEFDDDGFERVVKATDEGLELHFVGSDSERTIALFEFDGDRVCVKLRDQTGSLTEFGTLIAKPNGVILAEWQPNDPVAETEEIEGDSHELLQETRLLKAFGEHADRTKRRWR